VKTWRPIRKWRLLVLLGALSFVTVGVVGSLARLSVEVVTPLALTALGGCLVANWKLSWCDCPRCGEAFFRDGLVSNTAAHSCRHCGARAGDRLG
jgi:hypothetical protein